MVSNNSVSLLDQQIHKHNVKVEECSIVGNEFSAATTDVGTALSSEDQQLLSKYVSKSDNVKDPNSQPDRSITASKDLIVTGMLPSDALLPSYSSNIDKCNVPYACNSCGFIKAMKDFNMKY